MWKITHKKSVTRHIRTCMIRSKDFKCEKCVKLFNQLDSWKRHTKVCKNGLVKKEIKCEVCLNTFYKQLAFEKTTQKLQSRKMLKMPNLWQNIHHFTWFTITPRKSKLRHGWGRFCCYNFEGHNEILDECNSIIAEDED